MAFVEGAVYCIKDIFAVLSLYYIFLYVFEEEKRGIYKRLTVFLILPVFISAAGQLLVLNGFGRTYVLLDFISNVLYLSALFCCFRKPPVFRTLAVVFMYIFTADMLWSFISPFFDAHIIAECIFNALVFGGTFFAIKHFSHNNDVNVFAGAFKELPVWVIFSLLLFELTCYYKEFGISAVWYDVLYAVSACMVIICILYLVLRVFRLVYAQNDILRRMNELILSSENAIQSDMALRSFRHDYKNHIIVINSLFEQGDIQGARQYFEQMKTETAEFINAFSTGNPVVNALLNVKGAQAMKNNIKIDFRGIIPDKGIDGKDMCIIMGNLIDNAIEAALRCQSDKRVIEISSAVKNEMLMLTVLNPCADNTGKSENGLFRTTKSDKKSHGIGLKNVKAVARKYGGELLCEKENGMFSAELMLSLNTVNIPSPEAVQ